MSARAKLLSILAEQSVVYGDFTLVSGKKSDFYVDSKLTTLDPRGALLIGEVGWEIIQKAAGELGVKPTGIGGLTMGADPIALAVGMAASAANPEQKPAPLQTFCVRKTPKAHGRTKLIEGPFGEKPTVVVVDDVITTGGSTLDAIRAIRSEGGTVAFALVLVDRQEGGRAAIEAEGVKVFSIFTREEIDVEKKRV
jgi:orotate phosphoribosyltransferase